MVKEGEGKREIKREREREISKVQVISCQQRLQT